MTANIPLSLASDKRLVASDKAHSALVALFPLPFLPFPPLFFLPLPLFFFPASDEILSGGDNGRRRARRTRLCFSVNRQINRRIPVELVHYGARDNETVSPSPDGVFLSPTAGGGTGEGNHFSPADESRSDPLFFVGRDGFPVSRPRKYFSHPSGVRALACRARLDTPFASRSEILHLHK